MGNNNLINFIAPLKDDAPNHANDMINKVYDFIHKELSEASFKLFSKNNLKNYVLCIQCCDTDTSNIVNIFI